MLAAITTLLAVLAAGLVALFYYFRLPKGQLSDKFVAITVGHRGCRWISPRPHTDLTNMTPLPTQIPENTLSSFNYAVDAGCTAIELDCRLTKDGHVVVMHDDIISRVCTVPNLGPDKVYVSDLTLTEVKTLRYKNWSAEETIPTLEEVLVWAQKRNVKVFVELKTLTIEESKMLATSVAAIFAVHKAWTFACVIAFHPVSVYYVRMLQPEIETCILYCEDFFQWGVKNKAERQHWWGPMAKAMDLVLMKICPTIVPLLTGCQLVGPDTRILTLGDINYFHDQLKVGVYCWVANTLADHDFFLNRGCSVGTDFVFPRRIDPKCILSPLHRPNMEKIPMGYAQKYIRDDPSAFTAAKIINTIPNHQAILEQHQSAIEA